LSTRTNFIAVRIAIALSVAGFFAAAARAQDPETIDAPHCHSAYVSKGQTSLDYFAFDAQGKRIIEKESYTAVLQLPAMASNPNLHVLGIEDSGGYFTAVFDTPEQRPDPSGGFTHHIQMWGGRRTRTATLRYEVSLSGGPGSKVRFFSPERVRDAHGRLIGSDVPPGPPWVFISVTNTTDYDDVYLLGRSGVPAPKLFSAWDFDVVDLANDHRYEIVAWQRMTYDLNCNFLVESVHSYPEVYADKGKGYVRVWPPSNWRNPDPSAWHADRGKMDRAYYQLQGTFADLRNDGKFELVALVNHAAEDRGQWLAAYEFKDGVFAQLAMAQLPPGKIAFMINHAWGVDEYPQLHVHRPPTSGTPHVIFRVATADKCNAGGTLDGDGTSQLEYHYSHDELSPWHRYIGAQ
jgi:hypothetical protein